MATPVASLTLVDVPSLPAATLPLTGAEEVIVEQNGVTSRATAADITSASGATSIDWTGQVDVALAAGQTDNWAPDLTDVSRVRANLAGDATITGLAGGTDGRMMMIQNVDAVFTLTILVENASSLAANRLLSNGDVIVPPGCGALFMYDGGLARWVKT